MIIIADDITGAAEIAGIAWAKGYDARLVRGSDDCLVGGCDTATDTTERIVVVATDTRSMTEDEAVAETRRVVSHLLSRFLSLSKDTSYLFKKNDSALRGHVVAELVALMDTVGFERAVYMPANPSKGRVIRNGVYYIDGVPIHDTAFSFDPEFPNMSSLLKERFPDAAAHHIVMPDAETIDDVRRIVTEYNDGRTLFAGAADLFNVVLRQAQEPLRQAQEPDDSKEKRDTLILCGSTQSKPLTIGIPVAPMPLAIYDGSDDLSLWDVGAYDENYSLILTIPYHHRTGRDVAVHLRKMMAAMTRRLVDQHLPSYLIIEGGATAWATLQALDWHEFSIERELAPGVVQMRAKNGTLVTLKPGSYLWDQNS